MTNIAGIIIVTILLCLTWIIRALVMHLTGWDGGEDGFCMIFLSVMGVFLVL